MGIKGDDNTSTAIHLAYLSSVGAFAEKVYAQGRPAWPLARRRSRSRPDQRTSVYLDLEHNADRQVLSERDLCLDEQVRIDRQGTFWQRSWFPDSFPACDDPSSLSRREDLLRTCLECAIPAHAQDGLFYRVSAIADIKGDLRIFAQTSQNEVALYGQLLALPLVVPMTLLQSQA